MNSLKGLSLVIISKTIKESEAIGVTGLGGNR